jgi:hypothetical protein
MLLSYKPHYSVINRYQTSRFDLKSSRSTLKKSWVLACFFFWLDGTFLSCQVIVYMIGDEDLVVRFENNRQMAK